MVLPGGKQDDATENHVDRGGHKRRSKENKQVLYNVRWNSPAALVFKCIKDSPNVANRFTYVKKPALVNCCSRVSP